MFAVTSKPSKIRSFAVNSYCCVDLFLSPLALKNTRHAHIIHWPGLVEGLNLRRVVCRIDLQLELAVVVQRDVQLISTGTIATEHELAVGEHKGANRRPAFAARNSAGDIDAFPVGFRGTVGSIGLIVIGHSSALCM